MKILKTYLQFEKIDTIHNIQYVYEEDLSELDINTFNLGEKLLYTYLHVEDGSIAKLIDMDIGYEYKFLKYAYDYDRISIVFEQEVFCEFYNFDDNELSYFVDYNSFYVPEEYVDIDQTSTYFDIEKLKKLLKITNDKIDTYDIVRILEYTSIEKQLDEIKSLIAYTYENAKQKIANDIESKIPFDISFSHENKTYIDVTIDLVELDDEKTLKEFLLKYNDILADAAKIGFDFYDEIIDEYLDDIPKIVSDIYITLENNIEDILKSLTIKKYNIYEIISIGGIFSDFIKKEEFQDKLLFNGDDLYNMTETYEKLKDIIHPNIKRKFDKLKKRKKFNI